MTCATMLERMLEADLDELTGSGRTALAMHVRACAKCRVVADRLVQDTRALASSIQPVRIDSSIRPRQRASRHARTAALAGVAATLLVIALRGWQHVNAPSIAPTLVMQPVSVSAPPSDANAAQSSPLPAIASRPSRSTTRHAVRAGGPTRSLRPRELAGAIVSAAVNVEPTRPSPLERAVPVAPVKLDGIPRPPLGDGVAVEPAAGKRANIIRTDRPGVTVVWLYD